MNIQSQPIIPDTAPTTWVKLCTLKSGHRIFRDPVSQSMAICDKSGTYPHLAEDGILWLAIDLPAWVCVNKMSPGEVYIALRVSGPRVGPIEKGRRVLVDAGDAEMLESLGFVFVEDESFGALKHTWLRLLRILDGEG